MLMRPWGCVINSFSFALDISVQELLDAVGHDGSEIVFPTLTEPFCRRGFTITEMSRVLLEHWYIALVTLSRQEFVQNDPSEFVYMVPNSNRIEHYVNEYRRFVVSNETHVCGFKEGKVYDARGICTKLDEFNWDTMYLPLMLP